MKKSYLIILLLLFLFINVNVNALEDIKNIKVNGTQASCSGYECSIEIDSSSATVTYEVGSHVISSSPSSGHKISDIESEYNVHIELILEDNDTPVNYTLTIRRHEKSDDGTLKKLIINDEEVELKEDVFVYSYEAKYNDEVIKVSGIPLDSKAKAESMEYNFDIDSSSTSINYFVTAEDGTKQKYTIVLKRKNKPDTGLKSINLSEGEIKFNAKELEYSFNVPYTVNTIDIEAIPNSEKAKVKIEKKDFLEVGENVIKIIVINEDVEDTYVLNINRLENMDLSVANLASLTIKDYKLEFKPNKFEYDLLYGDIPESLEIKAKALDNDAEILIENNKDLKDGSIILIKSRLSDTVERVYKLKISLQDKVINESNKTVIMVLIGVLGLTMLILFILQLKENKNKKNKKNKIIEKEISEIEII